MQYHLLCKDGSGAPWLGTPGWRRDRKAAGAMAKRALGGSASLWEPCLNAGSRHVEALKGEITTQRKCLTSLNLLVNQRCSIYKMERNKKKDAIYNLFHSHGSLKLMQECVWYVWWSKVCATHVTSNMHPAAACRDSCENPILVKSSWTSTGFPRYIRQL